MSLYFIANILEIAINQFLTLNVGEHWYEDENFLTKDSIRKVEEAKNVLQSRRESLSKNKIIAELSLDFWVNLFKKPYDKKLRIRELKKIFPNLPNAQEKLINRDVLYKELNHVRNLSTAELNSAEFRKKYYELSPVRSFL